jgi:type I restriction enzyme S subunit
MPDTVAYVDLASAKCGRIDKVSSYTAEAAPSRARRILRAGDTIVGTIRPGNSSYALIDEAGLTGSTGFAVLRPRETSYRETVYLAATASDNIETLALLADGGAYPAVRPGLVAETPLVIAPPEIAAAFSMLVGPILDRVAASERESRTLNRLRDALLPKLFSAELLPGALLTRTAAAGFK